jgi:drug/metabolite transporter (DMT)-like permease
VSWGFGTAVGKLTLDRTHMRPVTQQSMQLTASIIVLIVVSTWRRRAPTVTAWAQGRAGLLEPGLSYVLGLIGLSMTAASHAAIIGALEPTFVAVGSWMILRRRLAASTVALMSISLAGALLVITASSSGADRADAAGDVVMLLSVVCAAAYVMISSGNAGAVDPLTATLVQQIWAMAVVIPAVIISVSIGGVGPLPSGSQWLLVLISGLLSYLLPFALYLTAIESIPAAVAAQYLALIPLCGLIGAAVLLHESFGTKSVIGGAIVVAALVLLARFDAAHSPIAPIGQATLNSDAGEHKHSSHQLGTPTERSL